MEILFKELSFAIVGAAMEVHRTLGSGFLEAVYQKSLAHELCLRRIPFEEQVHLPVTYKDISVGDYIADFVADGKIILELKAVKAIDDAHKAQAINYLAATGFELTIILNFGEPSLKQERIVRYKKN
jgi:GxxExxY protein